MAAVSCSEPASQGFGRGFDAVDVEIFDEAQILTVKALNDMIPATNVSPNPLIVFMGTPPQPGDRRKHSPTKGVTGSNTRTACCTWNSAPTPTAIPTTANSGRRRTRVSRSARPRPLSCACASCSATMTTSAARVWASGMRKTAFRP